MSEQALRRWSSRSTTAPALPGGADEQVRTLTAILEELDGGQKSGLLTDRDAIDRLQKQIGVLGFTERDGGAVVITERGRQWLASRDPIELFRVFHNRLAYMGEMLHRLSIGPARVEDLRAYGADELRLGWSSSDQVRRRLAWLRGFGLVVEGPDRLHILTDEGKSALVGLVLTLPADLDEVTAAQGVAVLEAAPRLIGEALESATRESRSLPIGYLPKDPEASLQALVEIARDGIRRDELSRALAERLSISESSAHSFVVTARGLGVHTYTGKDQISPTPLGLEWLENASPLNLVRLMHANFLAVGELLAILGSEPQPAGQIHRLLFGERGAPNQDRTAIVLRRLAAAGAVAEIGHARYVITGIGQALLVELPLAEIEQALAEDLRAEVSEPTRRVSEIRDELIGASRDPANPTRFEKACATAFVELGVDAQHVGGPGRTDVIVRIAANLELIATAIVDAKASAGNLSENSIKFPALREHAAKVGATLTAVVSPGYEGAGRLTDWAPLDGVVLLTAAELADLVEKHQAYPYTPEDIVGLLTVGGKEEVEARRVQALDELSLVRRVVHELEIEAEQPTPEAITARDISRAMRDGEGAASEEQIRAVLAFLVDPRVSAVRDAGGGRFTLPASPTVAALRLRALATAIERAATAGTER